MCLSALWMGHTLFIVLRDSLQAQLRFWPVQRWWHHCEPWDLIIWYRSVLQSVPGKECAEDKFPGISFYGPDAPTPKRVKAHASGSQECKLWKTVRHYLLRLKTYILYDPEIPFLGLYSKQCPHPCMRDGCRLLITILSITVQTGNTYGAMFSKAVCSYNVMHECCYMGVSCILVMNKRKQTQRNVLWFHSHNIPKADEEIVFKYSDLGDKIIKKRKEIVTTEV